ncbi:MAG: ATP-dependent 6-phosphofructokinase [Candidatus Bipolaricaulota bacterium]|nr:ATP-dependent 6-phosphofructokinase [Candidatus Bipolaricaulota bacterium]
MRIGILTSGGDSPGMNAAVRAAVRCGTGCGLEMLGIRRGFAGMIESDLFPLDNRAVGGIIERGGTFLGSARSAAFLTEEGQEKALATIKEWSLDGLVVIGGNGSLKGAKWLQGQGVPVVGIPASIDNDIYGTAMAIGVDTALNTVMESLDRIRDTAVSHDRTFVVEVMGRSSGYIALMGGLAGGAELVLVPEVTLSLEQVAAQVEEGLRKGKHHSIIVVAEGFTPAGATRNHPPAIERMSVGRTLSVFLEESGRVETRRIETRLTILGHLQRGGSPSAFDRILASRLGDAAVRLLADGTAGVMTALIGQKVATLSLAEIDHPSGNFDPEIYRLVCEIAN